MKRYVWIERMDGGVTLVSGRDRMEFPSTLEANAYVAQNGIVITTEYKRKWW